MAQRDHFEHQLAAASGFAETDRGIFSGWRRHTRNLIARGSKSPIDSRGPGFEEAQAGESASERRIERVREILQRALRELEELGRRR